MYGTYQEGVYEYTLGQGPVQVVETTWDVYDHGPVYSLDDTRVAYLHHEYAHNCEIRIMRTSDWTWHTVAEVYTEVLDEDISLHWISDDVLVYKISRKGLYTINITTGEITHVEENENDIASFQVSPDLSAYAYGTRSSFYTRDNGVWIGRVGEWNPTRVSLGDYVYAGHLAWSPQSGAVVVDADEGLYWITQNSGVPGSVYPILRRYQDRYYGRGGGVIVFPL